MSTLASIEDFLQTVCTESHLRIEDDLGDGFVRLRSEEAERRQAKQDIRCSEDALIELLRNSRDAGATRIYVSLTKQENKRTICVIDNGSGIPEHLHALVFEPRVTSKLDSMRMDTWGVHGRGMALYSIQQNATCAKVLASSPEMGTCISVQTDITSLKEKTDQSTFPTFQVDNEKVKVLGPKNLVRTACEFALEARHSCQVYIGSATEIAAVLYEDGLARLSAKERLFTQDSSLIPVCDRLAISTDPDSFAAEASKLGLNLSSRSARRIMNGEIKSPKNLLAQISQALSFQLEYEEENHFVKPRKRDNASALPHCKGLSISEEDKVELANAIHKAYSELAHSYYLNADVMPEITCGKNGIRIFIPFEPID